MLNYHYDYGDDIKTAHEMMHTFLARANRLDDGAFGKAFEIAIRFYLQPRSKRTGVTKAGTWYGDIKRFENRKAVRYEVKTACGELGRIEGDKWLYSDILPNCDYVIYCPEVDTAIAPELQGFVFAREDFIRMLMRYEGRGAIIRAKLSSRGETKLAIQSFQSKYRPKASRAIADHLWEACYCAPSVQEFFSSK